MTTSTEEIETAVKKLDKSLKSALKHFDISSTGTKEKLAERYKQKVLEVGAQNFINHLKAPELKSACKAMKVKATEKEQAAALMEKVAKVGISELIDSVDPELLAKFCSTLGLEITEKDEMAKQIADEIMLTGMESFLNQLDVAVLKSHCTELELDTEGTKKDLVERLMVSIFALEPLEDDDKKSKTSKNSSKKESSKKESSKRESSEKKSSKKSSSSSSEEESSPKKKSSSSSKKTTKKATSSGNKRTAWVAPPLETIKKGKYDTYTALYDNFNLPDLVKYCKQKSLVCSGKKKDVINRILGYLKTGVVEEPKKKGKKRKAASSASKKATKKQKTSNSSSSETESTKESTKEKEPKEKEKSSENTQK